MKHAASQFMLAWIPIFVAMDVVGLVPLFLGLTATLPAERVRRIAGQAVVTAAAVALGFIFLGKFVFRALGIGVPDFQVAGGGILFLLAARELLSASKETLEVQDDVGVVPLGLPLITGPATLTACLLLVGSVGVGYTLAALLVNLALVYVAMRYSEFLRRRIGLVGLRAASKIMMLLLAAIAVNMIRRGWQAM